MSLSWLSPAMLLGGVAALAAALFMLQRLRVRHREVEVLTTMLWREAVDERRVRVFRRRFRHVWAYVLLLAIASLIWLLVAGPQAGATGGRRHVVLVDGGAAMTRDGRFERSLDLAGDLAARLPAARREVRLVAGESETLLGPGESLPVLAARAARRGVVAAPGGFEAALIDLGAGVTPDRPLDVYLVGDASVREAILGRLPEGVTVRRVPIDGPIADNHGIVALGVADAASGVWETVDVVLEIAPTEREIPANALAVELAGVPLARELERRGPGRFAIRDVPAAGATLTVRITDERLAGAIGHDDEASITLPIRPRIRVHVEDGVPAALRRVLTLDPAVTLVAAPADAEVRIGVTAGADLRVVDEAGAPAFFVTIDNADNGDDGNDNASLNDLAAAVIDDLAIRQIDAAALAEQAGREIRLTVEGGPKRHVALWRTLLEEGYDFRESRVFPIFVARAVRWLAARPAIIPWAMAGEPLPAAGPIVERPARKGPLSRVAGAAISVALLERSPGAGALTSGAAVEPSEGRGLDLFGLIGLVLLALLAVEWVLHHRGRVP